MAERDLFTDPMIIVSHETGNRYPAYRAWIKDLDEENVRLEIFSGMQGNPFFFAESDAVSIVELPEGKKRINVITEEGYSYTIRPVNDLDSEWLFGLPGIFLPPEFTEEIIKRMGEEEMADEPVAAGTPSVMAFTRDGEIESVAFDVSEVATYFRVDGNWSLEMPFDIEDTDTVKIQPEKAEDFVNRWDEKDDNLSKELDSYAVAEEE